MSKYDQNIKMLEFNIFVTLKFLEHNQTFPYTSKHVCLLRQRTGGVVWNELWSEMVRTFCFLWQLGPKAKLSELLEIMKFETCFVLSSNTVRGLLLSCYTQQKTLFLLFPVPVVFVFLKEVENQTKNFKCWNLRFWSFMLNNVRICYIQVPI